MKSRRAFVLLAVLWVMVGVSTLGVGIALVARRAVATARNRIAARRAAWIAEGCASRAQATIADALGSADEITSDSTTWRSLAFVLHASSLLDDYECNVSVRAAGSTLDINAVDSGTLTRLLRELGTAPAVSDSVVDAILDWRDADDAPRPFGAERSWYAVRHRPIPRDGPFGDIRELDLVRGATTVPGLDTLLGTERGRVSLNDAPLPVIAALPGFTREAVALIAEHRVRRMPLTDLLTFASELSPGARDTLESTFGELMQVTTTTPDAWVLTSRGKSGEPPITEVVELRVVQAGTRAAVVRRRTWIE